MDVVCTAGHVDHGKSTLVRALTGMEPDRFAEEQRRGLTIDIGFAWGSLEAGDETRTVAFVDLPGHERFIGNMLAGAGPVEATLFTVAADEGWKPQSSEHRDILDLLEVRAGVVAVTKADAATPEQLASARAAIAAQLAGTSLERLPVVEVSAATGTGLDQLRRALLHELGARPPAVGTGRPRLWVDRSFSIKGAGTVVTGTLTGGPLSTGQDMVLMPGRRRVRVRGLQSLQQQVPEAAMGDRVAVNLSGVDRDAVGRGDLLTVPDAAPPSALLDVEVRTLGGAEIGRRGAWHLHVGSGEWPVSVRPLEAGHVVDRGYVRILCDHPTPIATGDRFVLRDAGRRATVAGGLVLDAHPPAVRGARQRKDRVAQLRARSDALAAQNRPALLTLHVEERDIVPAAQAAAAVGMTQPDAEQAARAAGLVPVGTAWAHPRAVGTWAAGVRDALAAHHGAHPEERAAPRDLALRAAITAGCPAEAAADLLGILVRAGRVTVEGAGLRLPEHRVQLTSQQQQARAAVLSSLNRSPFAPPRVADAAAAAGAGPALLKEMEAAGDIVRLDKDLAMTASAVDEAVQRLRRHFLTAGPFTAAQAKETLQTSRKFALPLLEELDRRGITRREGDIRFLP